MLFAGCLQNRDEGDPAGDAVGKQHRNVHPKEGLASDEWTQQPLACHM